MALDSAVVLLSSGLDSGFNLFKAQHKFDVRLALTFNYGQRAADREIFAAGRLAASLNISHQVVDLPWFKEFTKTALVNGGPIPTGAQVDVEDAGRSAQSAKAVWVPNRNGIFLSIAAGFAEGLGAGFVIPGFNAEEAATFPDNSQAFLDSMDKSFSFSTATGVRTFCYSTSMSKTEIVHEALQMKMPLALLWPCYLDEAKWCGQCESCKRFKRAVEANGLTFEELQERPA